MQIPGTIVFTGEQSRRGYLLNRMAMSLTDPPTGPTSSPTRRVTCAAWALPDEEIAMVGRRDWRAMLAHGGSIYLLLKIAGALGISLQEVGQHTSGRMEGH